MTLRPRDVTFTVVSAMVGAGIFITPGLLLRQGAPIWAIPLMFLAAGLTVAAGTRVLADLQAAFPGNGGPYRYLRATLGPAGPLYNWARFWIMQCGALAVLALTSTRFAAASLGVHDRYWEAVVALALIGATASINARGLRAGAAVQAGLTVLKIGLLMAMVAGLLLVGDLAPSEAPEDLPGGLGSWLLLAVFAFGGWTQITFLAGEATAFRRPMMVGVAAVTAVYLAALAPMLLAGPVAGELVAAEAAAKAYGNGARVVAGVIAVVALGGLHTMTLTGPRLYQAAARDGDWWHPFARANRHDAPGRGLWFQALWAAMLVALSLMARNAFVALIGSISITIWTFHILLGIAWFRLPASSRTTGLAVAVAFVLAAGAVVAIALVQEGQAVAAGRWQDVSLLWAGAIVAAGVPLSLRRPAAV